MKVENPVHCRLIFFALLFLNKFLGTLLEIMRRTRVSPKDSLKGHKQDIPFLMGILSFLLGM